MPADIEPDGRLFRMGVSLDLIPRLATPLATRIAFLELEFIDATALAAAEALPRTWRDLATGWNRAEAVRKSLAKSAELRRLFARFHLDPGAAERRALLSRAEPVDQVRHLWELRHPVIDAETRSAARRCADEIEARVACGAEDVVPLGLILPSR